MGSTEHLTHIRTHMYAHTHTHKIHTYEIIHLNNQSTSTTQQYAHNPHRERTQFSHNPHTHKHRTTICSTQNRTYKRTQKQNTQYRIHTILHNLNTGVAQTICTNIVLIFTMNI